MTDSLLVRIAPVEKEEVQLLARYEQVREVPDRGYDVSIIRAAEKG